jgi:hypothetical protein
MRSEAIQTRSPFTERPQQVGFAPSSGFGDFRGERRKASKKDAPPEGKTNATVPFSERIGLFATSENSSCRRDDFSDSSIS